MIRNATAVWNGSGKDGNGHITTQSTVLNETQFSYLSRFESGIGTNPEELIASAHAGCFTMKLSFIIGAAGFTPEKLSTKCEITLDNGVITKSHLIVEGKVPGMGADQFATCVKEAEVNCLISKLFNTAISSEATLLA